MNVFHIYYTQLGSGYNTLIFIIPKNFTETSSRFFLLSNPALFLIFGILIVHYFKGVRFARNNRQGFWLASTTSQTVTFTRHGLVEILEKKSDRLPLCGGISGVFSCRKRIQTFEHCALENSLVRPPIVNIDQAAG